PLYPYSWEIYLLTAFVIFSSRIQVIINKIDLAPYVGADLEVMKRDTIAARGEKENIFTNLKNETGLEEVVAWIKQNALLYGLES
ncbi:hypothetical protein P9G49_15010, partial [Heyndrickxia coagulans]|nr:hypothetical protein [Heyndrickxia coagulans]